MCELYLPIPVTYHMRLVHPGCGKLANGRGYNSVGSYCEGWAGNCGDGGRGASSWYLMCEACHARYLDGDQHNSQIMTNLVCPPPFVSNQKLHSINAMKSSNDSHFDMFTMMKENALFLLELSSTNSRKLQGSQARILTLYREKIERLNNNSQSCSNIGQPTKTSVPNASGK